MKFIEWGEGYLYIKAIPLDPEDMYGLMHAGISQEHLLWIVIYAKSK